MPALLVATSNAHKTAEIQAMLGPEWQVQDLRAFPKLKLPEETGETFEENAIIKAEAASRELPDLLVLADDSGLEVDALGGEPGARSARYAGRAATDADNREKLLRKLRVIAMTRSVETAITGRFHCCMAFARGGKKLRTFRGAVEGRLILREAGEGGFGYDPLFVPQGHEQTFGELPAEVKNQISHRSKALAQAVQWLRKKQPAASQDSGGAAETAGDGAAEMESSGASAAASQA